MADKILMLLYSGPEAPKKVDDAIHLAQILAESKKYKEVGFLLMANGLELLSEEHLDEYGPELEKMQ